jgi:hypothetical protein
MGVYIYTMRAKTLPLYIFPDGDVQANLYSFAYRYTSYWKGDRGYNSYNLMCSNAHRHAHDAFAKERSGYVIVGDLDDGRLNLEGHSVYKDVKEAIWTDTERFPGTLVGWVGVQGKSLILTDRTPWAEGKVCDEGMWKPYKSRSILEHGIVRHERIVDGVHTISP